MARPAADEFNEYYSRYIDLVPGDDILAALTAQMAETRSLLASVPADREGYRYAEGKWSIRQAVGHVIDTEHVFAFRALWAARGAEAEQPSMEQDDWAAASPAGERPLAELAEEWAALRRSVVLMCAGFSEDAWSRRGIASGSAFSVRAAVWIIAGHELHHRNVLVTKYLGGIA
jgi:uncharacterized damage-inducible protein DinB